MNSLSLSDGPHIQTVQIQTAYINGIPSRVLKRGEAWKRDRSGVEERSDIEASDAWKKEVAWKSSMEERRRGEPRKRGAARKRSGAEEERSGVHVRERNVERRGPTDCVKREVAMMQRQRKEWVVKDWRGVKSGAA